VGSSVSTLQLANNLSNPDRIYPGQFLLVSEASERPLQYQVRPGDTLIEIASKFGTSLGRLQRVNQIDDPHLIYLGQVLFIP
jgi:LysM repeat protein